MGHPPPPIGGEKREDLEEDPAAPAWIRLLLLGNSTAHGSGCLEHTLKPIRREGRIGGERSGRATPLSYHLPNRLCIPMPHEVI